jgi:hypothetical protein
MSKSETEVSEEKIMEYMNYGQKRSFNRRTKYAGSANNNFMTLSEGYKTPENKFDYFLQKQLCKHKYVFPKFPNLSTKFKRDKVEENYVICQKEVPLAT